MPKAAVICYLSSLLFYGMGYSKLLVLNSGHVNTYNYTIYVSLATAYFVLTIFLAVIGSLFFYFKTNTDHKIIEMKNIKYRVRTSRQSDIRRRVNTTEVKARLSQSGYGVNLDRKMSS